MLIPILANCSYGFGRWISQWLHCVCCSAAGAPETCPYWLSPLCLLLCLQHGLSQSRAAATQTGLDPWNWLGSIAHGMLTKQCYVQTCVASCPTGLCFVPLIAPPTFLPHKNILMHWNYSKIMTWLPFHPGCSIILDQTYFRSPIF